MCPFMEGVGTPVAKKAFGAPEAREQWCKCCDEFAVMCHEEATTNPRYCNMKMEWKNEPPPPPPREY